MENKQLCVGIVGAGVISEIYLQNLTSKFDNLYVKSICDMSAKKAQARAEAFHIATVTKEEMLSDPEIDIIINLTPVFAHYDVIKEALLHGKHVYTEKTITDDIEKSAELLAIAKEKHLYLGAAPDTFLGAALQTARAAIDAGIVGEINSFAISGNRCNDILLSLFDFLRKPGGGVLLDYAVYYVTALVSLLGPVARVGSIVRSPYPTHKNIIPGHPLHGQQMDTPNESQVCAIIQMENGITGTLHIDADTVMDDKAYFTLYGTKGMLYLTDPNQFGGAVKFLPRLNMSGGQVEPVTLSDINKFSENARGIGPSDMAEAIMNRTAFRPNATLAYHVHEVLDAMLQNGTDGGFREVISTCDIPSPLPQATLSITKLAHAGFNAHNMDAMLDFYVNVLGMKHLFTLTAGDRLGNDDSRKWIEYLKLSTGQYIELFHHVEGLDPEKTFIKDRWENYGYLKLNYEVSDIYDIRQRLMDNEITLVEDVHQTVDGALEIKVFDPDGNEVQFTQYPAPEVRRISMDEVSGHESCSHVQHITQVAYQVKDDVNMLLFYTKGLNLKHVDRLTFGDLSAAMEASGAPSEQVNGLLSHANEPWIDYIEVAPHQYIELFYSIKKDKNKLRDLSDRYGYQHICLEVADIQQAWEAVCANGLTPDSPITLGCEGTYQFWLTDPDGNRLEFQQYTKDSKQLL